MLANPKEMVAAGFVKNLVDAEKQIQPNAIDFTVDTINVIHHGTCYIGEDGKVMRKQSPVEPLNGNFHLVSNHSYDISSDMYVEVPEGKAALLVLRSTFVRNGMSLSSGLYDSGFKGNIGAVLHTNGCTPSIQKGVRIGQIMFIDSDSVGKYAGGYNHEAGEHWTAKV